MVDNWSQGQLNSASQIGFGHSLDQDWRPTRIPILDNQVPTLYERHLQTFAIHQPIDIAISNQYKAAYAIVLADDKRCSSPIDYYDKITLLNVVRPDPYSPSFSSKKTPSVNCSAHQL